MLAFLLETGINEFLDDGPLHDSSQDWGNGNRTKISRLHRIGDFLGLDESRPVSTDVVVQMWRVKS